MAPRTFKQPARRAVLVIWSAAAVMTVLGRPAPQHHMDGLLEKLTRRIKASSDYKNWRASVVSTITKTDKNWAPEEVTVVTKSVRSSGEGEPQEEILRALQTKKGKTTDITRKYAEERRKDREKERLRREKREADESGDDGQRGGAMALDDLLPFSEKKRGDFEFRLEENPASAGPTVLVLEARAKVKSLRNWEGTFSFNPETCDLVGLDLRPSQMPKMVKELAMKIDFEVLGGRFLVLKRMEFKVNGGIFIKHVRQVVEDVYTDFEVLDAKN